MFDRVWRAAAAAVVVTGLLLGALVGSAWGWSTATRLTTSSATPFGAVGTGAFARPDGAFLLSGYSNYYKDPAGAGSSTGVAGGTFSAPAGSPVLHAVWLPGGTSLVSTLSGTVELRASDGTTPLGTRGGISGGVGALGADAAGNVTAAGVYYGGSYALNVSTLPAGGTSFTTAPSLAASPTVTTLVGLTVDPDGAAVVTWLAGSTLSQATRAAGASSFGPAAVISSTTGAPIFGSVPVLASNAAGRSAVVFWDGSGYSAAIREPGGAFGPASAISGPANAGPIAVAVAADGTAATLVGDSTPAPGPSCAATLFSLHAYRVAAGASTWIASGVYGGTAGDSVAAPVLAGGPGNRIDAAWTVETSSLDQKCAAKVAPYEIDAGTLGGAMTAIFHGDPSPLPANSNYGNAHNAAVPVQMALNACGDGALIFGEANNYAPDTAQDGLFTSTTASCPAGPPPPSGPTGPSAAQLKASLLAVLTPAGRPAKIAALAKARGYALTYRSLGAGRLTISWYLVPKGARVTKVKPTPVLIATASASFSKASSVKVRIRLTTQGARLLKHAKRLKLTAKGTFTPTGKPAVTALTTFILKR